MLAFTNLPAFHLCAVRYHTSLIFKFLSFARLFLSLSAHLSHSHTLVHLILVLIVFVWYAVCHCWFISYQTILNLGIHYYYYLLMSEYQMQFNGMFVRCFCCCCRLRWYCTLCWLQHKFHRIGWTRTICLECKWFHLEMQICNSTSYIYYTIWSISLITKCM